MDGATLEKLYLELQQRRDLRRYMTLRSACVDVLCGFNPEERSVSGMEKARRDALGMKIFKAEAPLELKAEQITLIKKLIGDWPGFSPRVLLDGSGGEGATPE